MKLEVVNVQGEKVDSVDLSKEIFEAPIKEDLMHQALVRQMANARLGTHKTKTRSEVSGGGRKPWRQKGTGRARHGSIRSPIWVGGGVAHKPRPRDYSLRMPRKMRRAALRSALSVKASQKRIVVVDAFELKQPKTQEMAGIMKQLVGDDSALILLPKDSGAIKKSLRNLPQAKGLHPRYLNVRDLLQFDRLLLAVETLPELEAYLGAGGGK